MSELLRFACGCEVEVNHHRIGCPAHDTPIVEDEVTRLRTQLTAEQERADRAVQSENASRAEWLAAVHAIQQHLHATESALTAAKGDVERLAKDRDLHLNYHAKLQDLILQAHVRFFPEAEYVDPPTSWGMLMLRLGQEKERLEFSISVANEQDMFCDFVNLYCHPRQTSQRRGTDAEWRAAIDAARAKEKS